MYRKQDLETAWADRTGPGAGVNCRSGPGHGGKYGARGRIEGESHKEERRREEGQDAWEGQGSKINRALFRAGNESPGFSLPASGIQGHTPSLRQLLGPTGT